MPKEDALRLSATISEVRERIRSCSACFTIAVDELCSICADPRRDATVVCVVEDPRDIVALERTREYTGRYHVLGGALSPLEGVRPEHLRIAQLEERVERDQVREVILCTNPTVEGDATAMYLARQLKRFEVRVTRLASGLPVGGDLEYADELTLGRALEGRREVEP